MLCDWSSDIVSFVAHCSIFTTCSVLMLGLLFWFGVTYPKWMCKSLEIFFSGRIRCSTKETSMSLFSWSTFCIAFWNYKVSWFLVVYFNLSLLLTFQVKNFSFWKLLVLHWKRSIIAPFIEHTVCIIFKVENVLNLAFWFSFDTSCTSSMFKTFLFLHFVCPVKEASIFFFLWSRV